MDVHMSIYTNDIHILDMLTGANEQSEPSLLVSPQILDLNATAFLSPLRLSCLEAGYAHSEEKPFEARLSSTMCTYIYIYI